MNNEEVLKKLLTDCKKKKDKIYFCNMLSCCSVVYLKKLGLKKATLELNGDVSGLSWYNKDYDVLEPIKKINKWKIEVVKLAIKNEKKEKA